MYAEHYVENACYVTELPVKISAAGERERCYCIIKDTWTTWDEDGELPAMRTTDVTFNRFVWFMSLWLLILFRCLGLLATVPSNPNGNGNGGLMSFSPGESISGCSSAGGQSYCFLIHRNTGTE